MLIPVVSDRPSDKVPLTVVLLVLWHFLVFGIVAIAAVSSSQAAVNWYANLSLVPSSLRWYSPLTYSLLHDDVFHLSLNMLFLWVFGGPVEQALGWKRFLGLYAGSAIATGLIQGGVALIAGGDAATTPLVGSSGAVSAVAGFFAVRFYRSRIGFGSSRCRVPAVGVLGAAVALEMVSTLVEMVRFGPAAAPGVAHYAHIGGLLLGVLVAQVSRQSAAAQRDYLQADASACLEHGAPLAAVERLRSALREQPGKPVLNAELGRAWAQAGDCEQARVAYGEAVVGFLQSGDRRNAAATYVQAGRDEATPDVPERNVVALAGALEEQGNVDGAIALFKMLRSDHPTSPDVPVATTRLARLLIRRGDTEDAAQVLDAFLDENPESDLRPVAVAMLAEARSRS